MYKIREVTDVCALSAAWTRCKSATTLPSRDVCWCVLMCVGVNKQSCTLVIGSAKCWGQMPGFDHGASILSICVLSHPDKRTSNFITHIPVLPTRFGTRRLSAVAAQGSRTPDGEHTKVSPPLRALFGAVNAARCQPECAHGTSSCTSAQHSWYLVTSYPSFFPSFLSSCVYRGLSFPCRFNASAQSVLVVREANRRPLGEHYARK
jgi:hypothetical protein